MCTVLKSSTSASIVVQPGKIFPAFYGTNSSLQCLQKSTIDPHPNHMNNCRAMAQTVNGRPLTAEARVRARVGTCGVCGGQSGTGTDRYVSEFFGFSLSTPFHHGSPHSYIMRGINNRPAGGRSSETSSYAIDMNMKIHFILSSLYDQILPMNSFFQVFRQKLLSHVSYIPRLDLIILLKSSEKYKYEAPQYVIFSILFLLPLLGPHNLLITLFSNTLFNLCCSFDVRDSIPRVGIYIVTKIKYREPVVI
jgi:hypothetical protein